MIEWQDDHLAPVPMSHRYHSCHRGGCKKHSRTLGKLSHRREVAQLTLWLEVAAL